jgi:glycosyltransferase involved in cell wall biosynthesis
VPPTPRPSNELLSDARSLGARDSTEQPLISVVVPTRNRPPALSRCLDGLAAQTLADRLEVIVVDDGSFAQDEVASIVALHPRARLILRGGGGPAAARNAGALAAHGAFLCFTDDDCEPQDDWVEQLVKRLQRGADAAAGTTLSSGGLLAAASEITAHAPAAARPPDGSDLAFAPSNNLACTKAAFEATPFDESYPDAAGEDREWCSRLTGAGYGLRVEPKARIVHHQELTLGRFLRQQARYGRGAFRFRRRGGELRSLESPGFYRAFLRRAFAESFSVGVLVCVAQAATAAGFVHAWAADCVSRSGLTSLMRARPSRRDGS